MGGNSQSSVSCPDSEKRASRLGGAWRGSGFPLTRANEALRGNDTTL